MPAWIHERAEHIRSKNPGMPKGESFAIATQQAHAAGKAPKGYGTTEGRRKAKRKYDSPKSSYKKTASIPLEMILAFRDELTKIAAANTFGPAKTYDVQRRRHLTTPAKMTSKPHGPLPPSPQTDPFSSSRSTTPPPVTSG